MLKLNFHNYLLFFLSFSVLISSCKKEEITTYENLIVKGNTPPNYDGVSEIQIEIYVSKLYIDLLGIQATQAEITSHTAYLKSKNLRMGARDTLLNQLIVKDEYYDRLYNNAKGKYLQGITEFQLNQEIANQTYIISLLYSTGDTFSAQAVELFKIKLEYLQDADSLYKNNLISVNKFYSTFCDNSFYDDINMGSLNFVQSCFEGYYLRPASLTETTNGVDMVDGQSVILLLQNGNSKDDFIRILTESDEFYQGLVIDNFRGFLSRNPNSYESYKATFDFKNSNDLAEMQKSILKTDEYAGF